MRSAWFVARLQLRRRLGAIVVLTLLVAVVGGVAASLVAGSRRSASVVQRYFARGIRYDLRLGSRTDALHVTRAQLLAMPGVVRADPDSYLAIMSIGPDGKFGAGINGDATNVESIDDTIHILSGRGLRADDPFSVLVNEDFVEQFGKRVGDDVPGRMFAARDLPAVAAGKYNPSGPQYTFHIVGVVRTPDDIAVDDIREIAGTARGTSNVMIVPIGFYDRYKNDFLNFGTSYSIQLADAARDRPAFEAAVLAASGGSADDIGFDTPRFSERRVSFTTPVDLESVLLLAAGVAVAVAGGIVVVLLLRVEERAHRSDAPTLRSLGYTRAQLGVVAAIRSLPVAVGGAALGIAVAYLASDRYPIGVGRELELDQGRQINAAVIAGVALGAIAVIEVFAFAYGRRNSDARQPHTTGTTLARWVTNAGAPVDVAVGTHLAFDRNRGTGSMPSRAAIAGGAIALAVVVSLGVFVAGIDHLHDNPAAHGWPWDVSVGNTNFPMERATVTRLLHDRRVVAATAVTYGNVDLDGESVEVLAIDPAGTAPPVVIAGRNPERGTEIALGAKLMRRLHAGIGSTVTLSLATGEFDLVRAPRDVELTVVGTALPPVMGESEIGEVGVVTKDALIAGGSDGAPNLVLARTRGPDPSAAAASLARDYTAEMQTDIVPARVVNVHRVRVLPLVGIALAAALGILLLAYTLAIGVRAGRRDYVVLRALGFTPSRLSRLLAVQGAMLAVGILLIGLPLGLLLGTRAWRAVAHQFGVGENAVVAPALLLLIPIAIAIGIACSVLPARRLRRDNIAALLHSE